MKRSWLWLGGVGVAAILFLVLAVLGNRVRAEAGGASPFSPFVSLSIENLDLSATIVPKGWPVPRDLARVSSEFGRRRHPIYKVVTQHNGLDFAIQEGTPVCATAEGVVLFAGTALHYGEIVKVWHEGDFQTFYAHNSKLLVCAGDRVRRGESIALSGNTGLTTGPHLHYEVRRRGVPENPRRYLD